MTTLGPGLANELKIKFDFSDLNNNDIFRFINELLYKIDYSFSKQYSEDSDDCCYTILSKPRAYIRKKPKSSPSTK